MSPSLLVLVLVQLDPEADAAIAAAKNRSTFPDSGRKPEPVTHALENMGPTEVHSLAVEIKRQ